MSEVFARHMLKFWKDFFPASLCPIQVRGGQVSRDKSEHSQTYLSAIISAQIGAAPIWNQQYQQSWLPKLAPPEISNHDSSNQHCTHLKSAIGNHNSPNWHRVKSAIMTAQISTVRIWNQQYEQSLQPKLAPPEISNHERPNQHCTHLRSAISNHDSPNWHRLKSAIITDQTSITWNQPFPMDILHLQNCLFSLFAEALCTQVYCGKGWKRKYRENCSECTFSEVYIL